MQTFWLNCVVAKPGARYRVIFPQAQSKATEHMFSLVVLHPLRPSNGFYHVKLLT